MNTSPDSVTAPVRFLALRAKFDGIESTMTLVSVDNPVHPERVTGMEPFVRETHSTKVLRYIEAERSEITAFEI